MIVLEGEASVRVINDAENGGEVVVFFKGDGDIVALVDSECGIASVDVLLDGWG